MPQYEPREERIPIGFTIACWVFGILIFLIWFNPLVIVGSGQRGVITHFGKVQSNILGEGIHVRLPIRDKVHKVTVRTQTIKFDNGKKDGDDSEESSLFAASKDLQDVQIAVVVNYHQNPLKVNNIYQQYGNDYESNIIRPMVRETIKSQSSQYTAEELVTKRAEFTDKTTKVLSERLASKDSFLDRVNVVNFQFSGSFNKAIEDKVTAEQNALAAKNKLEQVKYEADQRIVQAKGEAEAIKIQAEAIQSQGGAAYVNLKAVEKWDGKLPQYNLGSSTPFINLNK